MKQTGHKDFDGNNLKVGHRVAVQSYSYKSLKAYRIIGFTPCKVRVDQLVYDFRDADMQKRGRLVDPERVALLPRQED
jgi:hypothetical protein